MTAGSRLRVRLTATKSAAVGLCDTKKCVAVEVRGVNHRGRPSYGSFIANLPDLVTTNRNDTGTIFSVRIGAYFYFFLSMTATIKRKLLLTERVPIPAGQGAHFLRL